MLPNINRKLNLVIKMHLSKILVWINKLYIKLMWFLAIMLCFSTEWLYLNWKLNNLRSRFNLKVCHFKSIFSIKWSKLFQPQSKTSSCMPCVVQFEILQLKLRSRVRLVVLNWLVEKWSKSDLWSRVGYM